MFTGALCVPGESAIATTSRVAISLGVIEKGHGSCEKCALLSCLVQPCGSPGKLVMVPCGRVQLCMRLQTCICRGK